MFTAFIKILPVGEMPSHNHSAWTDTQGYHTHGYPVSDNASSPQSSAYDDNGGNAIWQTLGAGNHSHNIGINNTGSNQPHNNLPPYIAIYIWKRIA